MFFVCLLGAASTAVSQTNAANLVPRAMPMYDIHPRALSVNVNVVLVPVSVTDTLHHPVMGLTKQNFELFEGNDPQPIKYFYQQDEPISVALVLDLSGSMDKQMDQVREAVNQFFANANPLDDYTVITVSSRPEVLARGTRSLEEIQVALENAKGEGYTALLDSIHLAVTAMKTARWERRVLLIVSDGMDNVSRRRLKDVASVVEESDMDAYALGIRDEAPPIIGAFTERMDKKLLMKITDVTGGHTVVVEKMGQLPGFAAKLSQEMRSQYVLGYRPPDGARERKWRKIQVKVNAPETQVRTYYRKAYFTPGD